MTNPTITPPPKLMQQWREQAPRYRDGGIGRELWLMDRSAQWGADQRLEACCDWLREAKNHGYGYEFGAKLARKLRAALCPKPPSLAEQGLEALRSTPCTEQRHYDALFAALNRLKQLEALPDA